jgi:hypothetical protein
LCFPFKLKIFFYLFKDSEVNTVIKDAYLNNNNHEVNVVIASWGWGAQAGICYNWAVDRVPVVGAIIAEFLDFLLGREVEPWSELTIVGHSLGAHVAGFVGKSVRNGKIGKIIALDPGLKRTFFLKNFI